MAHLIDKDAIVAEIEKKLKEEVFCYEDGSFASWADQNHYSTLESIKNFIDTLEVKEVEEPNASDRGMAEEIIINLKRVEQDYRIDLAKEIEWLRNKVKKGE